MAHVRRGGSALRASDEEIEERTTARVAARASLSRDLWIRRYRDLTNKKLILRRLAFAAEALDQRTPRRSLRSRGSRPPDIPEIALEDARVVVAITHWRYAERWRPWDDDEVLLSCVRRLLDIPAASMQVIILTNDRQATQRVLENATAQDRGLLASAITAAEDWESHLDGQGPRVVVLEPSLRWPRHTGPYLTWAHKAILRRAFHEPSVTHFVYLEDDIGLSEENLRYWLRARRALEPLGLIPGFLLFEWYGGEQYLIQQTQSGQHRTVAGPIDVPGLGRVSFVQADLPYHASYVMDRRLAFEHFDRSAFRSPFRSRVAGWGVHERAAAGPLFGPSRTPLRNVVRLGSAPYLPPARNAIPVLSIEEGSASTVVVPAALVEHLRPTYSRNPAVASGKLRVQDF